MKNSLKCFCLSAFCLVAASSFAGNKDDYFTTGISPTIWEDTEWLNQDSFTKAAAESLIRAKRQPAQSVSGSEDLLSKSFREVTRPAFLKIKTANELHAFMVSLNDRYATLSADEQIFAAQLLVLKSYRGILLRIKPLVADKRILHSYVLSSVKQLAAFNDIFLNTDQWQAGLDYLSQPYDGFSSVDLIKNESDFQMFMSHDVYLALSMAAKRIAKLNFKQAVCWDNKMLYGRASFVDSKDRYRLVGEAERVALLASYHLTMSSLASFGAYSLTDATDMVRDLGKLYGVDGFGFGGVNGAPASKRVGVIRKYKKYGLLVSNGAIWMERSFRHLKESVRWSRIWWNEVESRPSTDNFVINADILRPVTREMAKSLDSIEAMINGATEIRSAITGEVVKIDLPKIFSKPPADLKKFLPTGFKSGEEHPELIVKWATGETKEVEYRDFSIGKATDWDISAYQTSFLPNAKVAEDIVTSIRVLGQSWGTWMAALPFTSLVL